MRTELENIEKIEQYLAGELSADAKTAFEAEIKAKPELQQQVAIQQDIMNRLKVNAFREEVKEYHQANYGDKGSSGLGKGTIIALLFIGLAVAIASGIYFWPSSDVADITDEGNMTFSMRPENTASTETEVVSTEIDNTEEEVVTEIQPKQEISIPDTTSEPLQKDLLIAEEGIGKVLSADAPVAETSTAVEAFQIPKSFKVPFEIFEIDAEKGDTLTSSISGSKIYIPGNIMVDQKGSPIKGKMQIKFREYRNPADMAFSELPMTYTHQGEEHNFNSAGMFEIRGEQNGQEIQVKENRKIKIDYKLTENLDGLELYKLDDKTNKWTTKGDFPISNDMVQQLSEFPEEETLDWATQTRIETPAPVSFAQNLAQYPGGQKAMYDFIGKNMRYPAQAIKDKIEGRVTARFEVDKRGKIKNIQIVRETNSILDTAAALIISKMPDFEPAKEGNRAISTYFTLPINFKLDDSANNEGEIVVDEEYEKELRSDKVKWMPKYLADENPLGAQDTIASSQLTISNTNGNITSTNGPSIGNLTIQGFAVYNCDQIYRIRNKTTVYASYVDENNRPIRNISCLTLLDKKINAAFGAMPNSFVCNKYGDNVLILMTSDAKLYAINAEDFRKVGVARDYGHYTFPMKEIGKEVIDIESLGNYLNVTLY